MITLSTATSFFVTAVVLGLAPGPDNLYVLSQASIHGVRAGWAVVFGLCLGILVHTLAITVGLAALFAASPRAYTVLQFSGAAYLLYLAWTAFNASARPLVEADGQANRSRALSRRLILKGLTLNLSNPKVALFFLALLPQFTDPSSGSLAAALVQLGVLFAAATLIVFGAVAVAADRLGSRLRANPNAGVWLHKISGAVFVLLALALLLSAHPG